MLFSGEEIGSGFEEPLDSGISQKKDFSELALTSVSPAFEKKTVLAVPRDRCSGCAACVNICPKAAISMEEDPDGFFFPSINRERCIQCGLCLSRCPVEHPTYQNNPQPACYALMAPDQIRLKSSSGGAFTLIAEWILEQGGVVCGAAYTENYHNVQHIIVDRKEDLSLLRGSKYVQSQIGDCYRHLKGFLDKGCAVLFTGTPCQVAGLRAFLGKDYPKLYTADIVCHGTPPAKLYRQFIEEQEAAHGSQVCYVSFRDKSLVGWNVSTTIRFKNGDLVQQRRNDSSYLNAFLKLLTLRASCGACKFAALPRQGDVTLADFWDVHRLDPSLDDQKGTSTVLVNNEKGKEMLRSTWTRAKLVKAASLEHAIKYNWQIKYSSKHHKERNRFFDLIRYYHFPVDKAVHDALHRHFDIGYIGWWYGANYGSVMTSFAMNRVLRAMGKTVLMIDFPFMPGQSGAKPDSAARRFGQHFYETSNRRQIDKHEDLNNYCDMFLVGSDQLWHWWSNRDIGTYHYFLDFADEKHKKISYATSFGHENGDYPGNMLARVSYLLHRFDAISVREASGVTLCQKEFGVDATLTLDPVFLCSMEDYAQAIALSDKKDSGPYVLAYILNLDKDKIDTVQYVANKKHLPYYIIIDGQADQEKLVNEINDPHVLSDLEIADWLAYFRYASYIVTDSYHGFCFATIFSKEMVIFPNELRGTTRFDSLGSITGLNTRFVNSFKAVKEKNLLDVPINFSEVSKALSSEISSSKSWLRAALELSHQEESAQASGLTKWEKLDATITDMKKQIEELLRKLSDRKS